MFSSTKGPLPGVMNDILTCCPGSGHECGHPSPLQTDKGPESQRATIDVTWKFNWSVLCFDFNASYVFGPREGIMHLRQVFIGLGLCLAGGA